MEKPTQSAGAIPKPKKRKAQYKEADLNLLFKVVRIAEYQTPLMKEWIAAQAPVLNAGEQYVFDRKLKQAINEIDGWGEEELKMNFISAVLDLGNMAGGGNIATFYDKTISATVEGTKLTVKPDFMMAKGFKNVLQNPYFHFHEYKPQINPTGEPMAQLLQAFLIAQVTNNDGKPLYGAEVFGASWRFVIMEGKNYCVSRAFDSTDKDGLLHIIAMLRKFRHILETRLIGNDEL